MGLEHLGVVVGDGVDAFSRTHRAALTGQQFQSLSNEPYYVRFHHVDDWIPQRLVTATGPDPLPR